MQGRLEHADAVTKTVLRFGNQLPAEPEEFVAAGNGDDDIGDGEEPAPVRHRIRLVGLGGQHLVDRPYLVQYGRDAGVSVAELDRAHGSSGYRRSTSSRLRLPRLRAGVEGGGTTGPVS